MQGSARSIASWHSTPEKHTGILRRAVSAVAGIMLALSAVFGFASSAQAASVPMVQYFYVPFPEEQILAMLTAVENGGPSAAPTEPITTYVTITAVADGTIICYDQWENGYDVDLAQTLDTYNATTNPDGTQIWGDQNLANGAAPGVISDATDVIDAGSVISLQNAVATTTRQSIIDFDGGDKFAASKTIAVTRTSWAGVTGTLFAGCVEVFDTNNWGIDYRAPVGTNAADSNEMFQYTAMSIMAGTDGTWVDVDLNHDGDVNDAGELDHVALNEGQSTYVTNVLVGSHVTSNYPIQVDIFSGDVSSNYESRDSALMPTDKWTDRYYTPVSTADVSTSTGDERTSVWLYNGNASAITVTYERRNTAGSTSTNNISVGAGQVVKQVLDNLVDGAGAVFYTSNGATFYAYSTTDSAGLAANNQAWDWSFTLIPDDMLTTQALIGLGIGRDPTSATNPLENGNPVWVTTVGNGDTPADFYVDYDGDPSTGRFTDPSGFGFDAKYTLRELEQTRVYVPPTTATGVIVEAATSAAQSNSAISTLTFTHDSTGNVTRHNRLLLVGVAIENYGSTACQVNSVTYGGVPLTLVGYQQYPGTTNDLPRVELWALANSPAGSGDVVVTLSAARAFTAGATTFSGVDVGNGLTSALGSFVSTTGSSRYPSVNAATSADQVVFDVVGMGDRANGDVSAITPGANQTGRWTQLGRSATSGTRYSIRGGGSTELATGGVTTMSWSNSNTYHWAIGAVPIKPMPAGAKMDQTGILIYTLDTGTKLAIAWGQDPWTATAGAPGLDVGTSVPPMPEFQAAKDGVLYDDPSTVGVIDGDLDGDGYISPGDVIEYPIIVYNTSRVPVPDVIVWDTPPADTTYVPGSTTLDGVTIPDDGSGTAYPLDGVGTNIGTLLVGQQKTVSFRVTIDDYEDLDAGRSGHSQRRRRASARPH